MERGDIYLVGLDPSTGHEQQGRRPVLIVSPGAFNRLTKVPVVLPITSSGAFARTAGFAVSLQGAGTQTVGVVRCDQPRALDIAARGGRRVERVPDAIMDEVRSQGQFSHCCTPSPWQRTPSPSLLHCSKQERVKRIR